MKKIIFGIVMVIAVIGLWGLQQTSPQIAQNETTAPIVQSVDSVPSIQPASPVRMKIAALKLDAAVEPVGLDSKGNMDVPKANENVGWYTLGYKPGEQGSVVIAGHLDTKSGTPAVFYTLNTIKPGNTIEITDEKNSQSLYKVETIQSYRYDGLPLQELFASKEPLLRLITCKGSFDTETKNYSDRLVVTARLQSFK